MGQSRIIWQGLRHPWSGYRRLFAWRTHAARLTGRLVLIWTIPPPARSTRGMRHLVTILVAVATLQAHAADVQTITARVVGVHDGDTITALTDDKRQLKVRVHGIDATELPNARGWMM